MICFPSGEKLGSRNAAAASFVSCRYRPVSRSTSDTRFSKDKSPYKTNLGTYIAPGGRKSMQPGYYFHIEPGKTLIAGGKRMPDGPELLKIRTAIADNTAEFRRIVEKKSFAEAFGRLHGDSLKTAPKGFDPEHEAIEYLKLKEFMAWTELKDDEILLADDFSKQLIKLTKEMWPLVSFLREALA